MSQVRLTQHETGVTLDFPLPEDAHQHGRRRAWRTFEIGMFLLVGAVTSYVMFATTIWIAVFWLALALFAAGVVMLVLASGQSRTAWQVAPGENDLAQLSVADNMLIRTSRDQSKQTWHRPEIREFVVEISARGLFLAIEMHAGDKVILVCGLADTLAEEARLQAEFEWIATTLRQALLGAPPSQAVQDLGDHGLETRIQTTGDMRITGEYKK